METGGGQLPHSFQKDIEEESFLEKKMSLNEESSLDEGKSLNERSFLDEGSSLEEGSSVLGKNFVSKSKAMEEESSLIDKSSMVVENMVDPLKKERNLTKTKDMINEKVVSNRKNMEEGRSLHYKQQ